MSITRVTRPVMVELYMVDSNGRCICSQSPNSWWEITSYLCINWCSFIKYIPLGLKMFMAMKAWAGCLFVTLEGCVFCWTAWFRLAICARPQGRVGGSCDTCWVERGECDGFTQGNWIVKIMNKQYLEEWFKYQFSWPTDIEQTIACNWYDQTFCVSRPLV